MVQSTPVLIDTNILIAFFNRHPSPQKRATENLIATNRALLIGPILTEFLRGIRRPGEANWALSRLRSIRFLRMEEQHWVLAGRIGRETASRGHRLPLGDLGLAAVALTNGIPVFTDDPHFDLIPGLIRFRIE